MSEVQQSLLNIGWIGLGKMGHPMAINLIKAGKKVSVFNRTTEKTKAHVNLGGIAISSIKELASSSDVIFTMISDDKAIEEIALSDDGIIANTQERASLIDMSTISPAMSAKVAEAATEKHINYLRAPVNGTVMQAEAGSLVILCSGPKTAYEDCLPLLEILGSKIFYIGEDEQARFLKLCINAMVGISSSMMGEALAFGEAGGLDWNTMIDVISSSAVGSPILNYKKETLKKRDFTPAFTARQMAKDFDLVLDTANLKNIPMPITSTVRQHWSAMIGTGRGELDYFAYVEMLEELAGIKRSQTEN
ncbi:MAG TPA: NAD(P)-dependent oxidoreductase [Rhodospirillales bacterium]|nr:NAD(P)-dependent oxidoreductase [Rhodospirillales bacterium]